VKEKHQKGYSISDVVKYEMMHVKMKMKKKFINRFSWRIRSTYYNSVVYKLSLLYVKHKTVTW